MACHLHMDLLLPGDWAWILGVPGSDAAQVSGQAGAFEVVLPSFPPAVALPALYWCIEK